MTPTVQHSRKGKTMEITEKKNNKWLRYNWWDEEKWFGEAEAVLFSETTLWYYNDGNVIKNVFKLTDCTPTQVSQCKSGSLDDNDI